MMASTSAPEPPTRPSVWRRLACLSLALAALVASGCARSNSPPDDGPVRSDRGVDHGAPIICATENLVQCGEPQEIFYFDPEQRDSLDGCHDYLGTVSFPQIVLNDFRATQSLVRVRGRFLIVSPFGLDSFAGTECLTEVGALVIYRIRFAPTGGFRDLHTVHGDVVFQLSALAVQLPGLWSLERIEGDLQIVSNNRLRLVDALPALRTVGGDLILRDLPEVSQEEAEAFAARIEVGGEIVIEP